MDHSSHRHARIRKPTKQTRSEALVQGTKTRSGFQTDTLQTPHPQKKKFVADPSQVNPIAVRPYGIDIILNQKSSTSLSTSSTSFVAVFRPISASPDPTCRVDSSGRVSSRVGRRWEDLPNTNRYLPKAKIGSENFRVIRYDHRPLLHAPQIRCMTRFRRASTE